MNEKNRFEVGITGLSEDMMDFIFEKSVYYSAFPTKFWTSFYKTCSDMVINLVDLSEKQLNIINREYKKQDRGSG
jgi:hypothetical protein